MNRTLPALAVFPRCVILPAALLAATLSISFHTETAVRAAEPLPLRWVFVSRSLRSDQDVEDIRRIVETASQHGLNGMVLSAGLDRLCKQPPEYFGRLDRILAICRENNVELIPQLFSVGYGGSVLAHDRNLAAGIPLRGIRYHVTGNQAEFVPDGHVVIDGGDFESFDGDRVNGARFHDRPGDVSFVDDTVFAEGAHSLRFENMERYEHGHGRVMFEVPVKPYHAYRVTCFVKTEGLQPEGCFRVHILADNRPLSPQDPRIPSTSDWRKVVVGFNSWSFDKVRVYAGVWGATGGKFWVDGLQIEEVGPVNLIRREGTPVTVRNASDGTLYEEGRDFLPWSDPRLNFRFDHPAPPIVLTENSRIPDGADLVIDAYHAFSINHGQVTVCMSEPALYDVFREEARLLKEHVPAKRFLLSMDEIRQGGSCEACRRRRLSMGEILGDCITKQTAILREQFPDCEVFIWSDMLDPNHNAHGDYYLVEGDFTGSWNHIPRDLVIVCWYYAKREESLAHFSKLGFRTLAGAYYDGDTLENPRNWLDVLNRTPKAVGIMYTTWQNKYDLLDEFGDLVTQPPASVNP
ncbi:hypothetical protein JCM19992_09410 [Thermostilla marina]